MNRTFLKEMLLSSGCLLACLSSCSRQDGPLTVKVTGSVTMDGEPLPDGDIIFRRADGDQKGFGGRISNGTYQIIVEPGKMAVEISAKRVVPNKFDYINGRPDPFYEMYIPKQYNSATVLVADVNAEGKTSIPFELKSK